MENFNNEIFGFGNEIDEEIEKNTTNFNYDNISGLGQSDYENEDLFKMEDVETVYPDSLIAEPNVEQQTITYPTADETFEQQDIPPVENYVEPEPVVEENNILDSISIDTNTNLEQDNVVEFPTFPQNQVNFTVPFIPNDNSNVVETQPIEDEQPILDEVKVDTFEPFVEEPILPVVENVEEKKNESTIEEHQNIQMSETPIEEIKKLTEYEEEKIESTDINSIFDRLSVNVKDASDIFKRNTEMKNKIDTRFEELKKLQSEVETSKKKQIDEINKYKEEVLNKLTDKKEEIEKRLNILKNLQSSFEKDKLAFEEYKKEEKTKIDQIKKDVQAAYDERREELNHIEDVLRKQKDALDEQRSQLALDKIEYESNKNDLANNLLKFNELVNSFTNGVSDIKE